MHFNDVVTKVFLNLYYVILQSVSCINISCKMQIWCSNFFSNLMRDVRIGCFQTSKWPNWLEFLTAPATLFFVKFLKLLCPIEPITKKISCSLANQRFCLIWGRRQKVVSFEWLGCWIFKRNAEFDMTLLSKFSS